MRTGSRLGVALAVVFAAAAFPAGAGAVERVNDGSFEARTVCGTECTNDAWARTGERVFFCEPGKCSGGPASGTHWVQFGGGTAYYEEFTQPFFLRGQLTQRVDFPAGPASLRYAYRVVNSAGFGELVVRLDGAQIFAIKEATPGEQFVKGSRDVSSYAGPGKHDLRFEFVCSGTCTLIYLDDVSLDAPDPPLPQTPTGSTPSSAKCRGRAATIVGAGGTLSGTPGPDVIVGSAKAETIKAKAGDDLVCAGGGPDRISGGPGVDILAGQKGRDRLNGGPGADILLGGPGRDTEHP